MKVVFDPCVNLFEMTAHVGSSRRFGGISLKNKSSSQVLERKMKNSNVKVVFNPCMNLFHFEMTALVGSSRT